MIEQETNLTQNTPENQAPIPSDVKRRIFEMQLSGNYLMLEKQYLAKKLNRSKSAITRALAGDIPGLLARIARHLDWLERRRKQKAA